MKGAYPTLEELLEVVGLDPSEALNWGSTTASARTRTAASGTARWTEAQEAIRPTSNAGPLFGVTKRDLERAAKRLSLAADGGVANPAGKRVFDIVSSALLLVALLPVLLIAAVATVVSSRGPVFYRAERVGASGKTFWMIKLRTMVIDADTLVVEFAEIGSKSGIILKTTADPRVTPVGRVLRKYGVDEVPALFNVLRGEMSLVGPRPRLRREVDMDVDGWTRRVVMVPPGVTGLWQIVERYGLTWEREVRLDLSYVENWSVAADVMILFMTLKQAFRGSM